MFRGDNVPSHHQNLKNFNTNDLLNMDKPTLELSSKKRQC